MTKLQRRFVILTYREPAKDIESSKRRSMFGKECELSYCHGPYVSMHAAIDQLQFLHVNTTAAELSDTLNLKSFVYISFKCEPNAEGILFVEIVELDKPY